MTNMSTKEKREYLSDNLKAKKVMLYKVNSSIYWLGEGVAYEEKSNEEDIYLYKNYTDEIKNISDDKSNWDLENTKSFVSLMTEILKIGNKKFDIVKINENNSKLHNFIYNLGDDEIDTLYNDFKNVLKAFEVLDFYTVEKMREKDMTYRELLTAESMENEDDKLKQNTEHKLIGMFCRSITNKKSYIISIGIVFLILIAILSNTIISTFEKQDGWDQFCNFLETDGTFTIHSDIYDIEVSSKNNSIISNITIYYSKQEDSDYDVSGQIYYGCEIFNGEELSKIVGKAKMLVEHDDYGTSEHQESASASWNISEYTEGDELVWDKYENQWTMDDGYVIDRNTNNRYLCAVNHLVLGMIVDAIEAAIEESNLNINMKDIGFTSLEAK